MRVDIVTKSGLSGYENPRLHEALTDRGFDVALRHPNRFAMTVGAKQLITYDSKVYEFPEFVLSRRSCPWAWCNCASPAGLAG
jgi:hypothetical protein